MERHRGYNSIRHQDSSLEQHNSRIFRITHHRNPVPALSCCKSIRKVGDYEKIASIKHICQIKIKKQEAVKTHHKTESLADDQDLETSCIRSDEEDDAELEKVNASGTALFSSKFEGRPSTLLFRYPKCCEKVIEAEKIVGRIMTGSGMKLSYCIYGSEYKCIVNAFEFNGWKKTQIEGDWHVLFDVRGSKIKKTCVTMNRDQRFNHFAGCWHLGRKDELWRSTDRLRKAFPAQFGFLPRTFIFPYDYERFQTVRSFSSKGQLWIRKPVASSKGRNINVFKNQQKVYNKRCTLVSQYISRPHLINKLKYDMRIYVLVTSFNPLKVYVYENGLARFATQKYKTRGRKEKYIHLTNFSVNKNNRNFIPNRNTDNPEDQHASKWSLLQLKQYFMKNNLDYENVMKQVQDIVVKTCIAAQPFVLAPRYRNQDKSRCSFELFGFDVLLDENLKAWLMEVNVCPSLSSSSPFDRKIKHTLLADLLNLVGINPPVEHSQSIPDPSSPNKSQSQPRKYRFKNPNSVANLCYQNCLEMLSPQDWNIIIQNQQQLDRMSLGSFRRAFPRKENILAYEKYFQCPRYSNYVLWRHMLSHKSFLGRLKL